MALHAVARQGGPGKLWVARPACSSWIVLDGWIGEERQQGGLKCPRFVQMCLTCPHSKMPKETKQAPLIRTWRTGEEGPKPRMSEIGCIAALSREPRRGSQGCGSQDESFGASLDQMPSAQAGTGEVGSRK